MRGSIPLRLHQPTRLAATSPAHAQLHATAPAPVRFALATAELTAAARRITAAALAAGTWHLATAAALRLDADALDRITSNQ